MGNVSFQLNALGWKSFQSLCLSVLSEVLGQTVQGFFDSNDGGRDGAFYGNWKPSKNGTLNGSFTFQCKFTSKPDKQIHTADIHDELDKARRLAKKGMCRNYILLTNFHLTGKNDEKIVSLFESIEGIEKCLVFGQERICDFIRESPRLRMLVPRIYGLGDLSLILDERAQTQAHEILSSLGGDLDKFVMTGAHRRSARALVDHGFVLLLGEPACGKSTIAAALSMAALDEWQCSTIKVLGPDDFVKHWNPNEPKQFFWIDDAFGATQLDNSCLALWNKSLPHVHAAIKKGARVLFTSRDYIYKSAREYLKETAFPLFRESQVVINVQELTQDEREQILYNHIRLGGQTTKFKSLIKPYLAELASRPGFSPEIARRLGSPIFTKNIKPTRSDVLNFADSPEEFLKGVIQTLDVNARSALAVIFMRGGLLESPIALADEERRAVELLGGTISGVRTSLNSLNESMVLRTLSEGRVVWKYKHPTIRDAFAALVAEDPELLDIYLAGMPLLALFQEVSCGVPNIGGVKVNVPSSRYQLIIDRIKSIDLSKYDSRRSLHYFIAFRCEREFLSMFLESNASFIENLYVYSYLYAISDMDVIVKLNEVGLLPEDKRLYIVERIRQLAIETPDSGFLKGGFGSFFREGEVESILEEVLTNLIPNLSVRIDEFRSAWDGKEDPETTFSELVSAIKDYKRQFSEDESAALAFDDALDEIENKISEMLSHCAVQPDDESGYSSHASEMQGGDRSVFDDVDQ